MNDPSKIQSSKELAALGQRLAELETREAKHQRAAQIQAALYRIANAASAVEDMQAFYAAMHQIVGELMVANNFFIALYDEATEIISFPYAVDEIDPPLWLPQKLKKGGMTTYVLRSGQPQHITPEKFQTLIQQGEIEQIGTPSLDWLGTPLKTEGRILGVLVVQSYTEGITYSNQDLEVLTFVGQHIAAALERARLQTETHEWVAELTIINSVSEGLVKELDFQAIIELVGDKIREIFKADTTYIALYDHQNQHIRFPYYVEKDHGHEIEPYPLESGLTFQVIQSRQPLLLGTWAEQELYNIFPATLPGTDQDLSVSYLGVPMISGDEVMGMVSVQSYQEHAYDEGDVRLLSTLAASMSVALENARLFDETKRLLAETEQRAAELATINSISQALTAELDLDALIELVGEQVRQTFQAAIVYVALHDRQMDLIHFPYIFGEEFGSMRFGEGLTSKILETGQPLLLNENVEGRSVELGATSVGVEVQSYLGVPILVGRETIGIISVQSTTQEGRFAEADLHLLSTIAANVGAAIQNARLYRETQRRAEEMAALAEIGRDISATLDLSTVLEQIAARAQTVLKARDVVLRLLEPDGALPVVVAIGRYPEQLKATPLQLGQGIAGHVAQTGQAEIVNYPLQDLRVVRVPGSEDDEERETIIFAPLISREKVIGVMILWRDRLTSGLFTQDDLDFLVGLSRQATIAIENARLFSEAQQARAAAEQANQAKSAFLSTVSHELRTPLTSVLGFAKISQQSLENKLLPHIQADDRKIQREIGHVRENLEIIVAEGERLTTLINNVLDLAKIEAGKVEWTMQPLAISTVIERATAATAALFKKKGLALIKDLAEDLPEVSGDQDKLIQVVINLISNAVKFTEQGSVTCRAQLNTGIYYNIQAQMFWYYRTITSKNQVGPVPAACG